jgi:hypothetical protein
MTRERPRSHTLAVRFSRRLLPGRHSPTGAASPLLPKAALPGPERRSAPWGSRRVRGTARPHGRRGAFNLHS